MSYHVFFSFSSGLERGIQVEPGTLALIMGHVNHVESVLGYEATQYLDNPKHWKTTNPSKSVTDEVFCDTAENHNEFVRWLYDDFGKWQKSPPENAETITPEDAKKFWHALQTIDVPVERWTGDYYRARMESLYDVMRGCESEGVTFDEDPLNERQAAAVIILFADFLDAEDLRLDVPLGHDYLASSSDGGYEWCDKCGAILHDDFLNCEKKECPLAEDMGD